MEYQKINIVTGWIVFLIALTVYVLTVEPTASFWDCGEFIACSYKLEVPHPPGAPFFLLTGRLFSMLAGNDVTQVAYWVNMISVLSSAFFVLFLFWSITHLAKRVMKVKNGEETSADKILIMGVGITGACTCIFLDSFWFSAVEAEVYAMSALFTALVFWSILKWENMSEERDQARWLIFIAYLMGLSIGVHLLNLLTVPVVGLVIYFKYYQKITSKGVMATLGLSGLVIIIILEAIVPGIPSLAGSIEIIAVNTFGLPFRSGIIFFAVLFLGTLIYGIHYSIKHNKYILNTILLAFTFIMIGYSSYTLVLIRSVYNTPIDENNPEDIISFVSYLKREQYGSRPLFKGPYYTADLKRNKKGDPIYIKGQDKYKIKHYKIEQEFDPKHTTIFPRMYSMSPSHIKKYKEVVSGLQEGKKPSFFQNLSYFFTHQLGHYYTRYFLWNFSGRYSDIQDASWVGLIGAFEDLPEELANNKGRNIFFMLPLILGFVGMIIQYVKHPKIFTVVALLFFMTGAAIIIYLNTPPIEPRERDYTYSGSFCTFAIWIGFSVMALYEGGCAIIKNKKLVAILVSLMGLGIPVLMAVENWDDHDRSKRYFSVDAAKNYLSSCAPNAILFTGGDNDTFPLWYVQEVEGFRTDVRVVVLSYYNTDWYIEQTTRKAYDSEPLPYHLDVEDYQQGGLNDYLPVTDELKGVPINAQAFLKFVKDENPRLQIKAGFSSYNKVPSKSLFIGDIDTTKIKAQLPEELHNIILDNLVLSIKGRALEKKDLAMLDVIVTNQWERPIYLNYTSLAQSNLDLKKHLVQEGLAYRMLPVMNNNPNLQNVNYLINVEVMYENLMNKFTWRNLNDSTIYYTEDYKGFIQNSRSTFNALANALIARGEHERAKQVIKRCLEVMPNASIPYDYFNVRQIAMLFQIGEKELAEKVAKQCSHSAADWLDYYFDKTGLNTQAAQGKLFVLNEISKAYRTYGEREQAAEYDSLFTSYYSKR